MNTSDPGHCPQCGTPLPASAPAGLCPRCVMAMNVATETEWTGAADSPGTRAPEPLPTPSELTEKFPQLEIMELLGRGGMGAVYRARQKELDRFVALKILPPGIGEDPSFAARFAREAKALAKLNHPGIVTIYDSGRADGLYYFVMEFVDGVNLRQLLEGGRVSSREALAIVPQICDALQYAHDQGIVHRDIKPENILLDRRGRVKVADFGLAKLVGVEFLPMNPRSADVPQSGAGTTGKTRQDEAQTPVLTDAGKVLGTPRYMAPEQVDHPAEVDHRADIYALGVVFYQMLTGELPGKRIVPPSSKVHIDVRLDEVVLRALEKTPEHRYEQVSELKTDLEAIADTASGHQPLASQRMKPHKAALLAMAIPIAFLFIALYAIPRFQQVYAGTGHAIPTLTRLIFLLNPLGLIAIASILAIGAFLGRWRSDFRWMSRWTALLGFFYVAMLVVGLLAPLGEPQAEPLQQQPVAGDPPKLQLPDIAALEFRRVVDTPETDVPVELLPDPANPQLEPLRVERTVLLGTDSIERARLRASVPVDEPAVPNASTPAHDIEIRFTKEGSRRFADITRTNIHRRLAVVMQGRVLTAPRINSEITAGIGVIAGTLPEAERLDLVWALNRSVRPTAALNVEHEFNLGFDQERKEWVELATSVRAHNMMLTPMHPIQLLAGQPVLFDLDRDQTLLWPAELPDWNQNRIERWVEESGADLLAVLPLQLGDLPRLAVFVPKLAPAEDALWTDPPGRAALVELLLSSEAGPIDSEPLKDLHWEARIVSLRETPPFTYVFHTADGAVGLLRIILPAEPLTHLQFQYRLVD